MNSKVLIAAVAGFVVLFLLGFLVYGVLLMDFYAANAGTATGVMKETPNWLWLVLGEFLGALTLAVVLDWAGVRTAAEGMKKGAIFGFLVFLAFGLAMLGTMNISTLAAALVDAVVSAVRLGAAGAVIGMLLGRGGPAHATTTV